MKIYLDNAATTKPDHEVLDGMLPYQLTKTGNASSIHKDGTAASMAIERARMVIASKINAQYNEVYFTSCGTESNNLAIKGLAFKHFQNDSSKNHIITTRIEHPSVLNVIKWLKGIGFEIEYLPLDRDGFVDLEYLKDAIKRETLLVTIMHANNEIGTIEPIFEIGEICRERGILFHSDACQSFTKVKIDVNFQNLVGIFKAILSYHLNRVL